MSKSLLLEEVREIIRLRHYSIRTEEAYVQTIRRFILYHHKGHPREMEWMKSDSICLIWQLRAMSPLRRRMLPYAHYCFSTVRCCELTCHSLRASSARNARNACQLFYLSALRFRTQVPGSSY